MAQRRPPPQIEGLHSLKVDNISYRTNQDDLRRLFEKYGEIGDIHIPRDRYSRQSKGFAFVRYNNKRDAEYALERNDGRWLDGREIRVAFARYERPIDERGNARGGGSGGRRRSRTRSRSPRRSRDSRSRSRSRTRSPRRDENGRGGKSRSRSRSIKKEDSKSVSRSP